MSDMTKRATPYKRRSLKSTIPPEGAAASGVRQQLHFRQIEVFHAVMVTRSVSAAARMLLVSQPSLSRTVKRLEDTLRIPLFERLRGRLVPTAEAIRLFEEVDRIVRQISQLGSEIDRITGGESLVFRFGASPSVSRQLVPHAMKILSLRKPRLEFFLDSLSVDQMTDYLVTGRGECIVTIFPISHPLIASRELGKGYLQALIPANHRLVKRDILRISDLAGVDYIGFDRSGPHARVIAAFLAEATQKPRVKALVRFSEAAVALVHEGFGIALVDSFTAAGALGANVVVREIENAPSFTLYLHTNIERPHSQHVKALAEAIMSAK
jgi:DNA-binding transcriptional LysR family regulator